MRDQFLTRGELAASFHGHLPIVAACRQEQTARYYLNRVRRRTARSPPTRPTSKKARLEIGKVAITVAQLYLRPHVAAYPPGRIHRAVPSNKNR